MVYFEKDFASYAAMIIIPDNHLRDMEYIDFEKAYGLHITEQFLPFMWHFLKVHVEDHRHECLPTYKIEFSLSCKED